MSYKRRSYDCAGIAANVIMLLGYPQLWPEAYFYSSMIAITPD